MERHGKNPYGENLYRIIWAESRRRVVVQKFSTGASVAREIPEYPGRFGWILERWEPPERVAKCTPEQWYANPVLDVLGPFPHRGEYREAHPFSAHGPANANIDKLVADCEESRKREISEEVAACLRIAEREHLAVKNTKLDLIGDKFPAFGLRPMSGYGGGRGTKTYPELKTADEAGLPTQSGFEAL